MAKDNLSEPGFWGGIARDSLNRPREAARRLIALDPPTRDLLAAALAISCLGVMLAYAAMRIGGETIDPVSTELLSMPLLAAGVELVVMLAMGWLTWKVGALFGGRGRPKAAMTLVVWLNAMLLGIQALQFLALAILPALAAAIALVGMVWALWVFANYVTELHGFENPLMVMGGVVLTGIVLMIGLGLLVAILGLTPHEVG
ncbi:Yip1 family protein [Amaricoccus solimangrovi]|uniref:Yip1 domain-containing protein n=1 Tax=Amaricoccus solimangrovi TaxID=2589815 RepID=A0A501X0Z1_9RHOB|nr:Yip1 family protein [Amaricoccus solimangrovi]TPE53821.1 hypothetical protein FJM51_01885 [Amaricoccus solimangrovi]